MYMSNVVAMRKKNEPKLPERWTSRIRKIKWNIKLGREMFHLVQLTDGTGILLTSKEARYYGLMMN